MAVGNASGAVGADLETEQPLFGGQTGGAPGSRSDNLGERLREGAV